ncbi:MAG: hypothetical protein PHS14_00110 [Elusimicrobia bacterium]|nr:hypothetical protein [Elusimicrobiota bacterium]
MVAEVLDDGRGTRFGREVQTNKGPVVAVDETVKKGDFIKAQYRCGPNYGLVFFIATAKSPKSTCYDCKAKKDRAHTKLVYRTNTQGKSARVRVCEPFCAQGGRP